MKLTALVESPEHVCCRYRLAAYRPYLERAGHALELRPWPRRWWSWFRLERELGGADVVIVQRKRLAPWQVQRLRRAARFLVYDFDDAVFLRDSYSPRGFHSASRRQRFAALVRAADAVVAGNSYLLRKASYWAPRERLHVIPTCVDPSQYALAQHARAGDGVELVWIGAASTLQGLEAIRPLLEQVGQECPGVGLKLVCDRFLQLRQLPVLACPWSQASEAAVLAASDIGISWIPNDPWSRGKCGLKVLQYMAAGLPVIANPVGVQADLVWHGETGYLAETPDQWVEAVNRLAHDPDLRRRLGQAGRRRVETDYSVAAGATHWLRLLDPFAQRREAA